MKTGKLWFTRKINPQLHSNSQSHPISTPFVAFFGVMQHSLHLDVISCNPDVIQHEFVLELIASSSSGPVARDESQRNYLIQNIIIGFCDGSRKKQRLAAAAQGARYNNELLRASSITCRDLHITWQFQQFAIPHIFASPAMLAVLLVEHAWSTLWFQSRKARRFAEPLRISRRARRNAKAAPRNNGPARRITRRRRQYASSTPSAAPISRIRRRSQRRRHKPPPICKVSACNLCICPCSLSFFRPCTIPSLLVPASPFLRQHPTATIAQKMFRCRPVEIT